MKPKSENYITLEFLSRSANEGFARGAVACFAAQLDPTLEELGDIKTAVSEAVTNAIVHGYRDSEGEITLTLKMTEGNCLYIKITDKGCGIPDIKQAMEPLFTTAPEEERAGLGFAVMEAFTDSLKVTSRVGKGTSVTMKKQLTNRFEA